MTIIDTIDKSDTSDISAKIEACLNKAFSPTHLVVINNSHKHIGHVGALSGGGHYAIEISARIFQSKNRVESHQLIYQALGELMGKEIHALQIKISCHSRTLNNEQ